MRSLPTAVIHINFAPGILLFDARPIRAALASAAACGRIPAGAAHDLLDGLIEGGLALATRDYAMRLAVQAPKDAIGDLCALIPERWLPPPERLVRGEDWERKRDRVLLVVDSFLFEFRSHLDVLAHFAYDVLVGIGKSPLPVAMLSSGCRLAFVNSIWPTLMLSFGPPETPKTLLTWFCWR